jgi:NAD(P)-dependent dehydrogenase (short-subunit alcohol dehydrogenase family)
VAVKEPTAYDALRRFDVSGRSVLVTGGAHGLGLAIATAFAGAGCRIGLLDVDADGLEAARADIKEHADVAVFPVDVRDEAATQRAIDGAAAAHGGLDLLINAAAIYPLVPVMEMPADALLNVLNTNVAGYATTVRAAHRYLAKGGGRVINIASITFYLGIPVGLGAYIASKGAIIGLTRALARELGPAGINVNAIAPGAFPTRAEEIYEDREAYDQQIIASQCLKRRGRVEDIACATLFLASDGAAFITGQTLVVDGGWAFN